MNPAYFVYSHLEDHSLSEGVTYGLFLSNICIIIIIIIKERDQSQ